MGPQGVYTRFKLAGESAAGCFALAPHEHVPPYWGLYICTEDADASAAKAVELGGSALEGPLDLASLGRMAVIQDPAGAVFSLWQPGTHQGTGVTRVDGTLCWADLNTPDPQAGAEFYRNLFGWEILTGKDKPPDSYLHIKNQGEYIGGILPRSHRIPDAPPHWLIYFQVADADASTAAAKSLGARILSGPMTIENSLRLGVLADPQGAVFALFARL